MGDALTADATPCCSAGDSPHLEAHNQARPIEILKQLVFKLIEETSLSTRLGFWAIKETSLGFWAMK